MTSELDLTLLPLSRKFNMGMSEMAGLYAAQAPFRSARGRSSETLVIHLAMDGTAPIPPNEHGKLVKDLVDIYFKIPGSATTAMRVVAEELNDVLNVRNKRGANRSRQSAGLLTLAVFREGRIYLAQCGPTHSFLVTSSGTRHFYLSHMAWRGLGFGKVPNIRYRQVAISPGDVFLISENPPPTWAGEFLEGLWGLSDDELHSRLIDNSESKYQKAVIRIEKGKGELKVLNLFDSQVLDENSKIHSGESLTREDSQEGDSPGHVVESVGEIPLEYEEIPEIELTPEDGAVPAVESHGEEAPEEGDEHRMKPQHSGILDIETAIAEETPAEGDQELTDEMSKTAAPGYVSGRGEDDETVSGELNIEIPKSKLRVVLGKIPRWIFSVLGLLLILGSILGWMLISGSLNPTPVETPTAIVEAIHLPDSTDTKEPEPIMEAVTDIEDTTTVVPSLTSEPDTPTTSPTESPPTEFVPGATQTSPIDDMVLVYIPAGEFLMGGVEDDVMVKEGELPQHTIYLKGYWIDKTEVTNEQYNMCVEDGKCVSPYSKTSFSRGSYYYDEEFSEYPVIFVSWYDAMAYCEWAGRRLPTEAEWEKAARGDTDKIYPWGDEISCDQANYSSCTGDTTAVGSYPKGASPYGLLDMAGNVWEWVFDYFNLIYYEKSPLDYPNGPESGAFKVIRGGSWNDDVGFLRTSSRYYYLPENRKVSIGFRCVAISTN